MQWFHFIRRAFVDLIAFWLRLRCVQDPTPSQRPPPA